MLFSLQTSFAEVTDSVPCKTITAIGLEMPYSNVSFSISYTKHYLIFGLANN